MLLTQPRPLHSSICTAVLSLLSPSSPSSSSSPLLPLFSAPPYTHTHTHTLKGGGRKERNTHACTHTHLLLQSFQCCCTTTHPTTSTQTIILFRYGRRQCNLGISKVYCVVVSKPKQTVVFSVSYCPVWLSNVFSCSLYKEF